MATNENLLIRVLQVGDEGLDVYGVKRAIIRHLKLGTLDELEGKPSQVQQRFQVEWVPLVKRTQAALGVPRDGRVGPATERGLRKAKAFDAKATKALATYAAEQLRPPIVYLHPEGYRSTICQDIHPTLGLDDNWALDFCCAGGTPVVAPYAGEIVKISGRNPALGADQRRGLFGWNIYLSTFDNVIQGFSTHYGDLDCHVGQRVKPGDVIGAVGHWPGNEGRSHTHWGVRSKRGRAHAISFMYEIAHAPRVKVG